MSEITKEQVSAAFDKATDDASAAISEKAASKPWVVVGVSALAGFVLGALVFGWLL